MKSNIACFFAALIGFVLLLTRAFLASSGIISDGMPLSFDVDSEENIYIGTMGRISVYKDGSHVRDIRLPTSRAYCFYIENDELVIGCVSDGKGGIYDLEGRELSYGELSYYDIEDIAGHRNVEVNGHDYKLSEYYGILPYEITRDGVQVYRMPTVDYIFNGLPFWLAVFFIFSAIIFLVVLKVSDYQAERERQKGIWEKI